MHVDKQFYFVHEPPFVCKQNTVKQILPETKKKKTQNKPDYIAL